MALKRFYKIVRERELYLKTFNVGTDTLRISFSKAKIALKRDIICRNSYENLPMKKRFKEGVKS